MKTPERTIFRHFTNERENFGSYEKENFGSYEKATRKERRNAMFLQQVERTIREFYERYAKKYDLSAGDYDEVHAFVSGDGSTRVAFSKNSTRTTAYLDENDELHLLNPADDSELTEYAEEYGWSENDVRRIRFGDGNPTATDEKFEILQELVSDAIWKICEISGKSPDEVLFELGSSGKEVRSLGLKTTGKAN